MRPSCPFLPPELCASCTGLCPKLFPAASPFPSLPFSFAARPRCRLGGSLHGSAESSADDFQIKTSAPTFSTFHPRITPNLPVSLRNRQTTRRLPAPPSPCCPGGQLRAPGFPVSDGFGAASLPRGRGSRKAQAELACRGSCVEQVGQVWGNAQGPALTAGSFPPASPDQTPRRAARVGSRDVISGTQNNRPFHGKTITIKTVCKGLPCKNTHAHYTLEGIESRSEKGLVKNM